MSTPTQPLDIDAARTELSKLSGIASQVDAGNARERLKTAALLDIAESLRELAAYVNLVAPHEEQPDEPTPEPEAPVAPPLEVGDWVAVPLEEGRHEPREIVAEGESEGDLWVVYRWVDEDGEQHESGKVWASTLVRVDPPASALDEAVAEVVRRDELVDNEPAPKPKSKKKNKGNK